MKVLMINGSPHEHGSTFTALGEAAGALLSEGVESEIIWLGSGPVQDCTACRSCVKTGKCVFGGDAAAETAEKALSSDGFIFGTPVYYAHASGRLLSAMDRLFFPGGRGFAHKPAAAVAVARRGGAASALDDINKYFTIAQMPVVSSTYWNMVYGASPEDLGGDPEGLQTMRNLGRNMAWLIKCISLGEKNGVPAPREERGAWTNFVR